MIKRFAGHLNAILVILLLLVATAAPAADVGPGDLKGEDKAHFDRFRELFQYGSPDEFFSYAKDYERELKGKGYMMLYYKLRHNEGFYALRHNLVFRAMKIAEELDAEIRRVGARKYAYLATGLMADVFYCSRDRRRAEQYFETALVEAGDRDAKFTMRCYHSLAEIVCLKDSRRALGYIGKALQLARKTDNVEYESLSLATAGYVAFMDGDGKTFSDNYDTYQKLRAMKKPGFSMRYDNFMEIARMAFDGHYDQATDRLAKGGLFVDSSLVAIRILVMEREINKTFDAVKRRTMELDSTINVAHDTDYGHIATESSLLNSREEAEYYKKKAEKLRNWLIGLVAVFIFVYIMGRRRLWRKIQERNRDLNAALQHAEEADKMKSAFISNMSHEIRTPLNAVSGFSQILCQSGFELSEEEKEDLCGRIAGSVDLITSIVNELLELSKSESEQYRRPDSELEDVRVNELCRKLLANLVTKANPGVEMRFSTKVADDFTVRTHGSTVMRILTHLLNNAQKFTEQGHIELRCAIDSSRQFLNLSVTDTGIGIPESDRDRIFEVFEKADGNLKEGIGLGLPICQRLASSLGAKVILDPAYKEGSRFVLALPVEE